MNFPWKCPSFEIPRFFHAWNFRFSGFSRWVGTLLYVSAPSINTVFDNLQDDVATVRTWLDANKLSLHVDNPVCMLVNSHQRKWYISTNFPISLHNTKIDQVSLSSYLGIAKWSTSKLQRTSGRGHQIVCRSFKGQGLQVGLRDCRTLA